MSGMDWFSAIGAMVAVINAVTTWWVMPPRLVVCGLWLLLALDALAELAP